MLIVVATSCFKEEDPITPFDRGNSTTQVISTGNNGDYGDQVYYSISDNNVVKVVDRTSWDLGFETTSAGTVVRLNGANKMQASTTGITDFTAVTNLTSLTLTFDWDKASGSVDSVALMDWISGGVATNEVFIVDRGETPSLSSRGYKKVQILSVTNTEYVIRYANVDGSNDQTKTIPKQLNKNFTCFSLAGSGDVINAEPDADDWDLVFTQYMHTFYDSDPYVYYSVNGVLLNPKNVKAALVLDKAYSDITIDEVSTNPLSGFWNRIGYDWKIFDFTTELYQIDFNKSYLLLDRKGFYYKLRFIDFYNSSGIKGYPKFEFEKL